MPYIHEESIKGLIELLNRKRAQGQDIYIICDDAYRKLVYDGFRLPNLFPALRSGLCRYFSFKRPCSAGERIGYVAISPRIEDYELMVSGLMISMRTLGFVNAPALFQRIAGKFQRTSVRYWRIREKTGSFI